MLHVALCSTQFPPPFPQQLYCWDVKFLAAQSKFWWLKWLANSSSRLSWVSRAGVTLAHSSVWARVLFKVIKTSSDAGICMSFGEFKGAGGGSKQQGVS